MFIPQSKKTHSFLQFVFETVSRLFAARFSDSSVKAGKRWPKSQTSWLQLSRERVNNRVNSSPSALHNTVPDVLRGNRCAFRHVPRPVDWSCLNTANANSERENE
jgi:hypothetical protein